MSQHNEFPELTQQTQAAYRAGCLAGPFSATPPTNTDRRYLSAFLREAMKQARPPGMSVLSKWKNLAAIADNLHALPPLPPTLAEAQEADLLTPEGRDVVCAFLLSLGGES